MLIAKRPRVKLVRTGDAKTISAYVLVDTDAIRAIGATVGDSVTATYEVDDGKLIITLERLPEQAPVAAPDEILTATLPETESCPG